jgi:hypothetical protein
MPENLEIPVIKAKSRIPIGFDHGIETSYGLPNFFSQWLVIGQFTPLDKA